MSSPLVQTGELAPDFVLADGRRRLSDFRGSPVVLVFQPPHWDPARAEHVEIYNRLIASLPGIAGTRLLSIGGEPPLSAPWRALTFGDEALTLPILAGEPDVAGRYGVVGRHAVFVIDAEGRVRARHVASSGASARPAEIARALATLSAGTPRDSLDEHREADACDRAPARPAAWTRREFVATALGAAFALALEPVAARAEAITQQHAMPGGAPMPITLRVNGHDHSLTVEPRVTLLDALRDRAGLTGTKKGCDHGQCGACTVHVNGRRVLSCLTFAVMQQGKEITTIEGLAANGTATDGDGTASGADALHPLQQAFIAHDGFQCGYCTPGQLMSAAAMLHEPWGPDDADVREAMSGNICRCGAYPGIVAAIQEARRGGGARVEGRGSGHE